MNKVGEKMTGTLEAVYECVNYYDQKTAACNYHCALEVMPK
jgi:hypothetical protein